MPEAGLVYEARPQFRAYHHRTQRFAIGVAHRRAGKTVACIVDLLWRAMECKRPRPRYGYLAPLYSQAKTAAWDYLKLYGEALGGKAFEYELRMDLPNGARVRLYGADNPDALRGQYFDGVVLDEYAQMRPAVWPEIIRPALADREGSATFIGTPKGHNDFYKRWQAAVADPHNWFTFMLKASETGILPPAELEALTKDLTPEEIAQEMECSFEAAIKGAYYGQLMAKAEEEGRVCDLPHDPSKPVETWWDLGVRDATAIWFVQRVGQWVHLIDFYQMTGMTLPHYVKVVRERPYTYIRHVAPHDIEVTEWGGDNKTRKDVAASLGIQFDVAPKLEVEEGINAVRMLLPRCRFDRAKCPVGVEALKQYRADFDEKMNVLRPKPRHDEHSHAADAFRTGAVAPEPTDSWSQKLNYRNSGIV